MRRLRRRAARYGRRIARYAGPLFVFTIVGSTGFVLVAAYLMTNP
ncbi:hypothetical protein NX794_07455 [Streptomyces sp. LP11]|uniref:Integral membrane protein n=1 Tax=Streptomyces pyxinicus TaxID=2970331 RepID=A0ABT2AY53_9ACTN|nr:hypothetical protein [Streptomyces sp. LP11]MCS0601066.1 hypothetical protein [Streptomyces sp. LP11]